MIKAVILNCRIVLAVSLVALVASCYRQGPAVDFSDADRAKMDSVIGGIRSTDSLLDSYLHYVSRDDLLGQMTTLKMLGKRMREESQFDRAIDYHMQELQLAIEMGDTLEAVQAYNNIGTNFRRLGQLEDAMENHLQALSLVTECIPHGGYYAKKGRVTALNGIGNIYMTLQNWQQADSCLRQALQGEDELGSALGQAINYANLGAIMEEQGATDSAWVYYQRSLELNEQAGSNLGIALCHKHFGHLYEAEGRIEPAIGEYLTARDLMAQGHDDWHRLETILSMAGIYIKQRQYAEAQRELASAEETAQRIGSKEHLALVYKMLYELYRQKGDTQQALDHYIMSDQMEDSVVNIQKMNHIQNMRIAVANKRQQAELAAATRDLEQVRTQRTTIFLVACGILVLTIIFIIVMWYRLRLRNIRQRVMQQAQQTREHFFTNITHEFRTPLTVILGLGHQLEDQEVEDMGQVRSSAKMIVRQGNSLLGLINQLLDISKVRSAVGDPKWFHGNIVAYVEMIIQNFQPYADSKCQELTYTHSMTRVDMDFVPDYIQKIVSNLLSNSIKYTPNYGKINLTLEQSTGGRLKIQVFDTGCGISNSDLPHVFEPFYEGRQNTYDVGSGVGLSLTKMLIEAMDGDISVDSIEGQGSTFTVVLPVKHAGTTEVWSEYADDQAGSERTGAEEHHGQDEKGGFTGLSGLPLDHYRILIVEDNQDIAYYIGMQMEKAQVYYARGGMEGLKMAAEIMPDLIITDIMMPGDINGLDLCRQIRKDQMLGQVPIIIVSAKTTEEDRIKGLRAGADAYLIKPFNSEELLVRVKRLLERQQQFTNWLVQLSLDSSDTATRLSADDQQFLSKLVCTVYRLMPKGNVSMEAVAAEMAISRAQMNRRLLAVTGSNSSTYIMRLRMAQAKRLLKADLNMPIGDVAQKCGFDDVAYFSRIFKQTFDMTPTQYRQID